MNIEELIGSHIHDLEAYEAPDWEALAARAGLPSERLIRLDANENAFGPSPRVGAALARFAGYGLYPDYRALTAAVARYAGVEPQNVVLGNGGDEIIDLAVQLFVAPGQAAIVCPPAFGMYATCTQAHGGQVMSVPRGDDFRLDLEGIEAAVGPLAANPGGQGRPNLLFLTSPGNPDGQAVPLAAIRRLLALPLAVVVDEAYVEFGAESAVPLLADHPNLIVLRTWSKWAGLAGLRLGYALAAPPVAAAMNRLRLPYNVNAAAVVAALATFDDLPAVQATIAAIVAEREQLSAALAELPGVEPLSGQANFVLCRLPGRSGRDVAAALAAQGILVRSFAAEPQPGPSLADAGPSLTDALRITVGRPEQNTALLAALRSLLQSPTSNLQPPTSNLQSPLPRRATNRRTTGETSVSVTLDLDGHGRYQIQTGVGFLDHMLAQVAAHGLFDLDVQARGDLEVDEHHTVEDVAIALGQALDRALGQRQGLVRMGQAYAPLDEALALVVVDLSGRPYAVVEATFGGPRLGSMDSDLVAHFCETLAVHGRLALHARVLYGRNDHHRAEALFKALGRALDAASRLDPRRDAVPSTKGVL